MPLRRALATFLVVLITFPAFATDEDYRGSWFFGGFQFGPAYLDTNVNNELNKTGMHGDIKGIFSYYWSKAVVDASLGWGINWATGESDNVALIEDTVTTRAAVAEINPRYRLTRRWELGVQNQLLFGTDTRFGTVDAQKNTATLLSGPMLAYARRDLGWPTRFTLSAMTDWNVSNRQVFMAMMGVEFGFSLRRSRPAPLPNPVASAPLNEQGYTREYQEPIVTVSFDLDAIHFEFDRAEMSPRSKKIVEALGAFLAEEGQSWRMLRIEGHADSRGTDEYNQRLSERRAASVLNAIVSPGIPTSRVEALGYGESRPLIPEENEVAYAKNRRVEFIFDGVSEPAKFKEAIDDIRASFGRPEIFPYSRVTKRSGESSIKTQ